MTDNCNVFTPVNCAADNMIQATKLCSILERSKGRDFYDIVELVKTTKPDIDYIAKRLEFGRLKNKIYWCRFVHRIG